ncbi:hypothetical protein T310_2814 [Rasamsonia emersonii CBS 393.64]|uniref:DDE-1 domain-containing protein n=1 Tax=Rasamsonia emersonii (strain ATCC 16479 / CBS 393.64 / IMI 116815) TaxID=1408163 RepID=A0A0F4YZL7_RASE3|nr:hypothetical protein T310_2814 [Rasamsonia emersonii CBS 393.64]KKA23088.1 hypothetical protein T310_2814 [Rasamsonia emersonii CBS 393.64]
MKKSSHQRALCEDPKIINEWFQVVHNTIAKYGIAEQDIYNFDETSFMMGMISTAKVVTGSEIRGRPRLLQPGNREWYPILPKGWVIGTSDNGWTNDVLGMRWLKEVFHEHTKARTAGKYRLLILDDHHSHATAEFDQFCTENMIIPLYLPPHSSHLLQPLDVACFGPLKCAYGQETQTLMQLGINHIDKDDFITLYQQARPRALTASNICSGFAASGLVPFKPEQVLDQQ